MIGPALHPLPRTTWESTTIARAAGLPTATKSVAVVARTVVVTANRARLAAELEHELRVALGLVAVAGRG